MKKFLERDFSEFQNLDENELHLLNGGAVDVSNPDMGTNDDVTNYGCQVTNICV